MTAPQSALMDIPSLGKYFKDKGILKNNVVVGTTMTNMGIENAVNEFGANFVREDVGDKYILRRLIADGGIFA